MTEQEKNERRFIMVSALVILIVAITSGFIWRWTNEPMKSIVTPFADRVEVRWGNRFNPFVYEALIDAKVETLFIGDRVFRIEEGQIYRQTIAVGPTGSKHILGWEQIDELPSDAHRRMFEGQILLDAHLHPEKVRKARLGGLCYLLGI